MEEILKIIGFVASGILSTLIPCLVAIKNAIKKRRDAKTEAEKEAAKIDMLSQVNILITNAESTYKAVNDILKQQGNSAGSVKKDSVITKLQAYALQHSYDFDIDYWNQKIDEIVNLTRSVNAR